MAIKRIGLGYVPQSYFFCVAYGSPLMASHRKVGLGSPLTVNLPLIALILL